VIDNGQSSRDTAASPPLILRSTVILGRSPGSSAPRRAFEGMLLEHCERIVASGRSRNLTVRLELRFDGICPTTHEKTVMRVADELLSNAMEHGYHDRQLGYIFVHVISRAGVGIQVSVSDDGWGFDGGPIIDGNGFRLLRLLGDLSFAAAAAPFEARTSVTIILPPHRCGAAVSHGVWSRR
jgi:hypothetical protein